MGSGTSHGFRRIREEVKVGVGISGAVMAGKRKLWRRGGQDAKTL